MSRNPETGVKDAVPETGSIVEIEFNNANPAKGRVHKTIEENICFGRVDSIGGRDFLEETKTDFCVLMTIPRRCKQKILSYADWSSLKRKDELQLAKLKIRVNHTPSIRDNITFKKFCDETYEPELLDDIRLAFWSDPSKVYKLTDLTEGPAQSRSVTNKERYMEILNEFKKDRKSNASQDEVLRAATHMRNKISIVQGPPGAGKTRTLLDKIIALTKIGHKTLCVAGSNAAVDTDARAVWEGFSEEDKKDIKCLRLETNSAEKSQRLKKLDYAQYTGEKGEADKLPEYLPPREAHDHPATQNSLDRLCMEFTARQEFATKMLKRYDTYNQAYKAVMNYDVMKRSNVSIGMTRDYRIWEIIETDMQNAEAAYKEARS